MRHSGQLGHVASSYWAPCSWCCALHPREITLHKLACQPTFTILLQCWAQQFLHSNYQRMLPVSWGVIFVANLSIAEMILKRFIWFLSIYDLAACAYKPTHKFGIIPHDFFCVELFETLVFMDDSFGSVDLRITLAQASTHEQQRFILYLSSSFLT